MAIYSTGTRLGLIQALNDMRTYLDDDDQELIEAADSAISKLNAMTDAEYGTLELTPDFPTVGRDTPLSSFVIASIDTISETHCTGIRKSVPVQ